MLFSSVTFLFLFLPLTIWIYYLCPHKLKNAFLLLASIVFYAWGEPKYLPLMFGVIVINYLGALLLTRYEKYSKFILTCTVITNLSFLIYFKYFNFILENLNEIFKTNFPLWNIALPLGISFYTFQAISYTIDVYRKQVQPQKNFYKLALYITLFPQLIAGPIIKYHDIVNQIDNRKTNFDEFYYGLRRFIIGLAKKSLVANVLGVITDRIFEQSPGDFGTGIAWLGLVSWMLQFYYDFSSYADMAIGLGHMFGFTFMENFNYPYISKSMTEVWRRWHISLGTWFKDYLYIPLGGSRKGTVRKNVNIFIIFLFMGIWHGAMWTFVISGVYNGLLLVFENITKMNRPGSGILRNTFGHVYTMIAVIPGLVWFRSKDINYAWDYIKNLCGILPTNGNMNGTFYQMDKFECIVFLIALLCSVPLFKNMLFWYKKSNFIGIFIDIWLFALLVFSCMQISVSTYTPFLYFKF